MRKHCMRKHCIRKITAFIFPIGMAVAAYAANITGTVTNKTTNRPSAGDKIVLLDLGAGMADAAGAVTNAAGQYTLQASGSGPYLIRVDHQGGSYFIAAPQGAAPADITVYDVAPKVDGVGVDADMLLIETSGGNLRVRERYLVRNVSSPPRTQFSQNSFEVVLPEGAELDEAAATRPGGLGTRTHLVPLAQKGHYTFNVPIQPDQGEKETLFEVQYHFAYSGRHTLTLHRILPADHVVVYTAKGIEFSAKDGSRFKAAQEDPRVETHVATNVRTEDDIVFTVSGDGQMPADASGPAMQLSGVAAGQGRPGGGIGAPIASPDPLTGSKSWLLGGFATLLLGAAFVFLRRRMEPSIAGDAFPEIVAGAAIGPDDNSSARPAQPIAQQSAKPVTLLETLKEELFALEKDKISGRLSTPEYDQIRAGLEAVLKRTLSGRSG